MEPMMLGNSPPTPSSPGINQSHYLPNYLIGNDNLPMTPNSKGISPGRNRSFYGTPNQSQLIRNEPRTLRQKLLMDSASINNISSGTPVGTAAATNESIFSPQMLSTPRCGSTSAVVEKPGPPTKSLFDTCGPTKDNYNSILNSTAAAATFSDSPSAIFNDSFSRIHRNETYMSDNTNRIQTRPNDTSRRIPKIDTKWVTAFGINPRVLNLVIGELSECGAIVDKKIPAQGNWIHVKFSNFNEVQRALALNGKCIDNSIMVGVQLYYDREDDDKENASALSPSLNVRSLRQTVAAGTSNYDSPKQLNQQQLPQKSEGFITKALEYVFGW